MGWLRGAIKYLPLAWIGVKTLWAMYKARLQQKGFRDALESERNRRIKAEAQNKLSARRDDPIDDRVARIKREAEARGKGND